MMATPVDTESWGIEDPVVAAQHCCGFNLSVNIISPSFIDGGGEAGG